MYKQDQPIQFWENSLVVIGTLRKREKSLKTWIKTIKKDFAVLNLTDKIDLDWIEWKHKI